MGGLTAVDQGHPGAGVEEKIPSHSSLCGSRAAQPLEQVLPVTSAQIRDPALYPPQEVADELDRPWRQGLFTFFQDLVEEALQGQPHHIGAAPAQDLGRFLQLGGQLLGHPHGELFTHHNKPSLSPKFALQCNIMQSAGQGKGERLLPYRYRSALLASTLAQPW